jgi:hypothetical protein
MYAHEIPLNWISVFRCYRNVNNPVHPAIAEGWKREGQVILAKEATVYLWGIKRITNTGQFSPMFVQALAARMAAEMAVPLAENRQLQADLWNLYITKLAEAAARDGQQGSNEHITQRQLTGIRYGGGR